MIVYEDGKIVAISKNLLNQFNLSLEDVSKMITKIELEMAVLNQNSIELMNTIFKIKKEELLTLKNLDIYLFEKVEETNIKTEINTQFLEKKEVSEDILDVSIPKNEEIENKNVEIIEEEEEEKPIVLDFEDNISECEKIFEEKNNINDIIKKELQLATEELGINDEMANELFKDLLNQIINKKESFYKAIEENNYENLHKISHYLKGASLNLRLSNLAFIFKTIDEEAKNKSDINIIKNIVDKLYDYISPLVDIQNQQTDNATELKKVEINPKIKKFVLNTIRHYLETQDEQKFQKDKKNIEKLLNTKIDTINDLQQILKES